jgi:hypothetical protein
LNDNFPALEDLLLDTVVVPVSTRTPTKIRKRRERFAMVPMWWYERLMKKAKSAKTGPLAIYLAYRSWQNKHMPFKLPNGMLGYDGASRKHKRAALQELEGMGLISVERRPRKSPLVTVHLKPVD